MSEFHLPQNEGYYTSSCPLKKGQNKNVRNDEINSLPCSFWKLNSEYLKGHITNWSKKSLGLYFFVLWELSPLNNMCLLPISVYCAQFCTTSIRVYISVPFCSSMFFQIIVKLIFNLGKSTSEAGHFWIINLSADRIFDARVGISPSAHLPATEEHVLRSTFSSRYESHYRYLEEWTSASSISSVSKEDVCTKQLQTLMFV